MNKIVSIIMLLSQQVMAGGADELHGKIAVMAFVEEKEPHQLMKVVGFIQEKLLDNRKVELLPSAEAIRSLGGPGYTGSESANLERLWGNYQQGYIQSYNFEYRQAIESLRKVVEGLKSVSDSPARWDLYELANIYLGISHIREKEKDIAVRVFQSVLRTRPKMKLRKKDYPPEVRKIWAKARRALGKLPKGALIVETDPNGAQVIIDGVSYGSTPLNLKLPYGVYFMQIVDRGSGSFSRWVDIGENPSHMRFMTQFEVAMVSNEDYPAIRLPKDRKTLPAQWWPWLGARLGIKYIALVRDKMVKDNLSWSVSLVDLERSRVIREGWLESSGTDTRQLMTDASDLSSFLITGRRTKRVAAGSVGFWDQEKKLDKQKGKTKKKISKSRIKSNVGRKVKSREPTADHTPIKDTSGLTDAPRPLLRKFWPYTIIGGLFLATGIVGQTVSADFQKQADNALMSGESKSYQQSADTWKGVFITGYCLAAASVLTGIISYYTYHPEAPKTAVWVGDGYAGIVIYGRF